MVSLSAGVPQKIKSLSLKKAVIISSFTTVTECLSLLANLSDEQYPVFVLLSESGQFQRAFAAQDLLSHWQDQKLSRLPVSYFLESDNLTLPSIVCVLPQTPLHLAWERWLTSGGAAYLAVVDLGQFIGLLSFETLLRANEREKQRSQALDQEPTEGSRRSLDPVQQFIGFVAHDIRNPLSIIVAVTEALNRVSNEASQIVRYKVLLRQAALQALRISDDLLALNRHCTLRNINRQQLRLDDFLRSLVDDNQEMVRYRGMDIVIDHCQSTLATFDPALIRRALLNLIDNACKHGRRGDHIWVSAYSSNDQVPSLEIIVRNLGHGIAPKKLPTLFEPFNNDAGDIHQQSGYGLGLAIAKRFVEMHGGVITVSSCPQNGTSFTLRLPPMALAVSRQLASPQNAKIYPSTTLL